MHEVLLLPVHINVNISQTMYDKLEGGVEGYVLERELTTMRKPSATSATSLAALTRARAA